MVVISEPYSDLLSHNFLLSLFFLNQLQNELLSLYVVQPYSLRQQKTEIKEILNKPKSTIFQIPGADCGHSPKFSGGDFQGYNTILLCFSGYGVMMWG